MKRNIYVLIGIFAVLMLIAFFVLQRPGEQSESSSGEGLLFNVDSASVDRIDIKSPSASLALEKQGTDWFITKPINYRANQSTIGQLIHQIKNYEISSVVSSKPEKHAVFQVDQSGTQVTLYEKGAEKAAFVLGKMAASYTESYLRKNNSSDVLVVDGAYSYFFNRPLKEWRDRTILSIPKEAIKNISYQYGDTVFNLVLSDSIWIAGKERVSNSKVDGILTSLSNLQADDFIDSAVTPKITAVIKVADVQIRFSYIKKINKYYVQSSNSNQCYVMEQWRANQILKRKKDLIETVNK